MARFTIAFLAVVVIATLAFCDDASAFGRLRARRQARCAAAHTATACYAEPVATCAAPAATCAGAVVAGCSGEAGVYAEAGAYAGAHHTVGAAPVRRAVRGVGAVVVAPFRWLGRGISRCGPGGCH